MHTLAKLVEVSGIVDGHYGNTINGVGVEQSLVRGDDSS
jgi:hypothetical protein